nr:MAG TPA: hypothetical protein [Caudoviricetes sp.]
MFIPIIFCYSVILDLNSFFARLIPLAVRHYIRF